MDESPFNLHLRRQQGRSKKGTRANVIIPTIRGRSVSLISSIGVLGMHHSKIIDNGTVNANIFADYITELCQYLYDNCSMRNVCIILDNARIHKRGDLERITTCFNYEYQFLSPYSYMLNPIENAFSKIKCSVREILRNNDEGTLSNFILQGVQTINPEDCAGYFRQMNTNLINAAAGLPYVHQ